MRMFVAIVALALALSPAPGFSAEPVPDGYVLQPLKETDGSILRPTDWFFESQGTPSGWTWTISKEKPSNGAYRTGMRIQLLIGVASGTGKTREEFSLGFLRGKEQAGEVLSKCEKKEVGIFYRQCLEVIEETTFDGKPTKFHVLYSVLWGKEMDIVGVMTFGSPPEDWEGLRSVSEAMSEFVLIGPNLGK